MMEREPVTPEVVDDRRQMIAALTEEVLSGNQDSALEIAVDQDLVRPSDLVAYMDVKRTSTQDFNEFIAWDNGLTKYLDAIKGHAFPEEEAEVIRSIMVARKPSEARETPDLDWKNDHFKRAEVDGDDIRRVLKTNVGVAVMYCSEFAMKTKNSLYIKNAVDIIEESDSDSKEILRLLLDDTVYDLAEHNAHTALEQNELNRLRTAINIAKEYSSDTSRGAILGSLDKFIFEAASALIDLSRQTNDSAYELQVLDFIDEYASSTERTVAMLTELGLWRQQISE